MRGGGESERGKEKEREGEDATSLTNHTHCRQLLLQHSKLHKQGNDTHKHAHYHTYAQTHAHVINMAAAGRSGYKKINK